MLEHSGDLGAIAQRWFEVMRTCGDDPEASAFREHSERWYDDSLRWGRETMGFALYLLERRGATRFPFAQ